MAKLDINMKRRGNRPAPEDIDDTVETDAVRELVSRAGARTKLSPELTLEICQQICQGASPQAAAASCGLVGNRLWNWLNWGKQEYDVLPDEEALTTYALFYVAVMAAIGVARSAAEQRVWYEKPEIWLTKGGLSGNWSDAVEFRIPGQQEERPQIESPVKRLPDNQLAQVLQILDEVGAFEAAIHTRDPNTLVEVVEADE